MEDAELREKLDAMEKKIDAAYQSAKKTRKYILTLVVISVVVFVLPLLALPFAISSLISTYSSIGAF